jgi:hypothetical protein
MEKLAPVSKNEANKDYFATGETISHLIDKINEIVSKVNELEERLEECFPHLK